MSARFSKCTEIFLLPFFLIFFTHCAYAGSVRLDGNEGELGASVDYLIEKSGPLDLSQASALYLSGKFQQESEPIPDFGIGSNPVWVHLEIDNPGDTVSLKYLMAGVTWLDRLDVYVLHSGKLESQVHTGDDGKNPPGLTPAQGFAVPVDLPAGRSDIYLRIQSVDPMVLPMELLSLEQLEKRSIHFGYLYGFFYGYLAALCIYNLLLFAGLRERSYLYYSLTLLAAIVCNFSYTGHGVAWLWPDFPWFQRYIILVAMAAYSVFGLLFASRFLSLAEHMPRTWKAIRWFSISAMAAMAVSLLVGSQLAAALLAFATVWIFAVGMFMIGLYTVRKKLPASRYFLAATTFGLLGAWITDLAVWGKISYTPFTFHAFEVGLAFEATLLALALAYKMRQYQEANVRAEMMARQDHLTGLSNRRAFMELAGMCWSSAARGDRSLIMIMMDIDHFKAINDQYGHRAGDDVLVAVSDLLKRNSRASDIVARWGGEEFIVLLTETDLAHAREYAEKLRHAITELRVLTGSHSISLTASFGVARCSTDSTLEDMIHLADAGLYRAKREGRNRICAFEEKA